MHPHVTRLPNVMLAIGDLPFLPVPILPTPPNLKIDDDGSMLFIDCADPKRRLSVSRQVFFYAFKTMRNLYLQLPCYSGPVIMYDANNHLLAASIDKDMAIAVADDGFRQFAEHDLDLAGKLRPFTRTA